MVLRLFTGARLDVHVNEPGNRSGPCHVHAANGDVIHRTNCGEYGGSFLTRMAALHLTHHVEPLGRVIH